MRDGPVVLIYGSHAVIVAQFDIDGLSRLLVEHYCPSVQQDLLLLILLVHHTVFAASVAVWG